MNISPASRRPPPTSDPALSPKRDAGGFAAATRKRLRGLLSRSLFRLTHRMQNWAIALDRETIDVPTSDAPPRLWSMADEVELMLADQKAELDAHDARSALLCMHVWEYQRDQMVCTKCGKRASWAPPKAPPSKPPASNIEAATLTKRTPVAPIKRGAALRAVKGKT